MNCFLRIKKKKMKLTKNQEHEQENSLEVDVAAGALLDGCRG